MEEFYFLDNTQISTIQMWLNFLCDLYEYNIVREIRSILEKSLSEKKISKSDCLRLVELLEKSNFEYDEQENDDIDKSQESVKKRSLIIYKRMILEFHNSLVYWIFMNSDRKVKTQKKYKGIFQNFD